MPCPAGAVCAGMESSSIAALEGYQRLDWSFGRVGFIKCDTEDVCRGVPLAVPQLADASGSAEVKLTDDVHLALALARVN